MKITKRAMICGMLALTASVSMCGCAGAPANSQVEEYNGFLWNDGDKSLNISYMNMEERKNLIRNYLDYVGFDYADYEFGDVYQNSNGNFSAESAYSGSVYIVNEDSFTVWLEGDGKAIDDRFMDDMNPVIQAYMEEKITALWPEAKVNAGAGMHRKPLKVWTAADGAENFLQSDENYVMNVDVVLSAELTQAEAEETLKNELGFLNRAYFYFYRADNPADVNPAELDYSDAEFKVVIEKN